MERGPRGPLSTIGVATVCVAALLLPLAAVPTTYDAFILPKLLVARFIVALLAVLLVVRWWTTRRVEIRRTPLDLPFALFVGAALISTLGSISTNLSFVGTYLRYDGWWTLATYAALFWLVVQTLTAQGDARLVLRTLIASAALASVIAFAQMLQAGAVTAGETAVSFGGFLRPDATFANPNTLATYLAMALPLGLEEFMRSRSITSRVLALAASSCVIVALLATFSRSAWLGAAAGVVVLIALARDRHRVRAVLIVVGVVVVAALAVVAMAGASSQAAAFVARVASLGDPAAGSGGTRLAIWADSLQLISSRPLFGYGPDTFGLVYPHFQSGNWTPGGRIDRAHAEVLQIAATQGLVGLVLYGAVLVSIVRAFASRPAAKSGIGVFAGVLAYQVTLQLNFTSLASAEPFWLLMAAALVNWDAVRTNAFPALRLPFTAIAAVASASLFAIVAWTSARAYAADTSFLASLQSARDGRIAEARRDIGDARQLAPEREEYAVVAGDLAGIAAERYGAARDWEAAREAYETAGTLGASDPSVFRKLAVVYSRLGRDQDAEKATRFASTLAPFD